MPATAKLTGERLRERIDAAVPGAIEEAANAWVRVRPEQLVEVMTFLRDDRELDGRYLNALSGVDRYDYFEVVYDVSSLSHNHAMTLKVRADHDEPEVPSVASVWLGAHLQEREVYDLLGVSFAGHPKLARMFLWDGFPGHPLRKDFMAMPGGKSPGLRAFPNEDEETWGGEFRGD